MRGAILTLVISASALAEASPTSDRGHPGGEGPHRKVLIIGIDGLRADAFRQVRPRWLDSLARAGASSDRAWVDRITRSGPGWASLFTGVWDDKHGVRDNTFAGYDSADYPSWFARLKAGAPSLRTAAVVNWRPLAPEFLRTADTCLAPGRDADVESEAISLLQDWDPDVLYLHFDAVDHAGHHYGFHPWSPVYRRAIRGVDARVGRILAALQSRPGYPGEAWLVVVATDHGGTFRHHGEDIPECRRVPFLLSGDGWAPGTRLGQAGLVDVAPTVFAFLGLGVDPAWGWAGRDLGPAHPRALAGAPAPGPGAGPVRTGAAPARAVSSGLSSLPALP